MNSINRGVGRPKGEEKVFLKRYVPKGQKEVLSSLVDAAMDKTLGAWAEKNKEHLKDGGWYFNAPAMSHKAFTPVEPAKPNETKALLNDIERLEGEVVELSRKLEAARMETESEKVAYWQAKYHEVANRLAEIEGMG